MSGMKEAQAAWSNRMHDIASLVRTARVEKGWSREDLADNCNGNRVIITDRTVRSVEDARNICFNADVMIPIIDALGISRKKYLSTGGFE